MHALIIEQDTWIALMIEDALTDIGYTSFDIATSDGEALTLASMKCPDLITSDVRLGEALVFDTVRSICSGRDIPVVFVTGTGWEVRERSPLLAVVQKPFAASALKAAVAQAVVQRSSTVW
jgi:DNA-binding response OmpR family regulator